MKGRKMKIEFKIYEKRNGKKGYAAIVEDKNGETLSSFLISDAIAFEEWLVQGIDEVLNGQKELYSVNGNACKLEVTKELAKVYDLQAESEEEENETCYITDPKTLKQIINVWCEKVREFKK